MQAFDIIAGLVLLTSIVTGLLRGAVREVFGVLSFLAATLAALAGLRFSGPIFRAFIDPPWMATLVAVLAAFGLVYLILRLLGAHMARRVLVVLGLFNLLFHLVSDGAGPRWVRQAALFPLTEGAGQVLRVFAPKASALGGQIIPGVRKMVTEGATSDPDQGYSDANRRRMDDLVERAR
jgi:membrane protein required for colicin V production